MIEVRAHQSLTELDPVAMEKVNASSANASLFSSPAWLGHFLTHDVDFRASQSRPLILAAWEGGALKGYLPLKASHDRGGRVLSSLITQEVERPRVVAAPEDDQRVTHAFFRSLLNCSEEWDLLEFVQQDASSPLCAPTGLTGRHWVRRLPDRENNVTALPFADMPSFLSSLGKNQRHHKRKALKQSLAVPGLKVLIARHEWGEGTN